MDDDLADELARLDEEIAELDREGGEDAAYDVAALLVEKADLLFEEPGREEEALESYVEAARRLSWTDREDARELRIYAANSVAIAHNVCGRPDEAFAVASRLVDTELDSAPLGAAVSVVNSAFLVANRHAADGQASLALGVLERVLARYAEEEVEEWRWTAGAGNLLAGQALEDLGRREDALARVDRAIAAVQEDDGEEERRLLAEALAGRASLLSDLGRPREAEAAYRRILDGFDPDEGPAVADFVTWADWTLGYLLFDAPSHVPRTGAGWTGRGAAFHTRVGRGAEAEAAYRKAIQAGHDDAWLWLGVLLTGLRTRRAEGEEALRRALRSSDPYVVGQAAFKLAVLAELRGEPDEARRLLTLASEHDVDETGAAAQANLGFLAAYAGDRKAAEPALRALYVRRAAAMKLDDADLDADWGGRTVTGLMSGRLTRGPLRAVRHTSIRLSLWRQGVMAWSRPARWIGRIQRL